MPRGDLSVKHSILHSVFAAGVALACTAALADKVRLKNGDVVTGEIVETTEAGVVLEHPVLGKVTIAADQIDAQVDGNAALPAPPTPPPPPRPGISGTSVLAGWNKQLQFGFTGSSGNSDNQDILAGVRGNYADDAKRWQFDSGYFRSSDDGDDTKNQAFAMLLRDFLFTGTKYFAFASTRYDYDQFQAWDHRLNLAAGGGYSFIDGEKFDLRGRAGFGGTKTFGAQGDDEWVPEAVIGLESEWLPADRQKITGLHDVLPVALGRRRVPQPDRRRLVAADLAGHRPVAQPRRAKRVRERRARSARRHQKNDLAVSGVAPLRLLATTAAVLPARRGSGLPGPRLLFLRRARRERDLAVPCRVQSLRWKEAARGEDAEQQSLEGSAPAHGAHPDLRGRGRQADGERQSSRRAPPLRRPGSRRRRRDGAPHRPGPDHEHAPRSRPPGREGRRVQADVRGAVRPRDRLLQGQGRQHAHLATWTLGMLGANGIVGGRPADRGRRRVLATSTASTKQRGGAFFGDGASNEGAFHEAANMAALYKLPIVFVCENNGYGEFTPQANHQAIKDVADRAAGYGMPGVIVDGMDAIAVYEAAGEAIERARKGGGPDAARVQDVPLLRPRRRARHGHRVPQRRRSAGVEEARSDHAARGAPGRARRAVGGRSGRRARAREAWRPRTASRSPKASPFPDADRPARRRLLRPG